MIIRHRNSRSYDEVMIKLPHAEFVMIYDHHNIFRKYGHWCFFACLFKCSLFNIFVYGSWICIFFMNILVNWSISTQIKPAPGIDADGDGKSDARSPVTINILILNCQQPE